VNPGTQNWFYYNKASWPAWVGGYRAVHIGYEFGGGYMQISRASDMGFRLTVPSLNEGWAHAEPMLSAVPIRAGVYLTIPLCKRFNFLADGGLSYYFRARYSDEWISENYPGPDYILTTTRAEKKKIPIGFQGGIGLEYELLHNFSLYLEARGRYARFSGLEGTSVLESSYATPFSEQGILYYESVPMLPNSPRLIMVQSDPPDGGREPLQAVVDFSGVSLQVGIRIRI
jgi:opacity protein-like surface antigen